MKYLELFSEKRVFDFSYVLEITKSKSLADETIQNYLKKGYIKRVKKNLYVTKSLENTGVIPTKFEIASNVTKSSYISHHSAFEYYGYSNQVYNEVVTSSMERFRDFSFEFNTYSYKRTTNDNFVNTINGVRVSTISKTIVDIIDDIKSYDDMEELMNNLKALPIIDGSHILEYLFFVNKKILFSKVGLVLSHFNDGFMIDNQFLEQMKKLGSQSAKYFTNEEHRMCTYYKEWNLYCYDMEQFISEK
jgi:predicted transcriptional regulator of viral defense system